MNTAPDRNIKEQLQLFKDDARSCTDAEVQLLQPMSVRERLAALLKSNLDFHGQKSGYASHDLHAFPAKFPPQLPRVFIRGLTQPGDIVLDPMMGSGTTLVAALLEGRNGVGLDLDPLALRLSHVKTTRIDIDTLRDTGYKIISRAYSLLSNGNSIDENITNRFDRPTRSFIDYWFLPATQRELMGLSLAIQEIKDRSIRHFLELTLSSMIVTKSGGVSLARDLAHSRPHLDKTKIPKNALEQFSYRFRRNLLSIAQLQQQNGLTPIMLAGDARCMPLVDGSIDLIVTSPPYANAIDYMRAHKFSLVWFGEAISKLSQLRAKYIGSERISQFQSKLLPERPETIIQRLNERDESKAKVLRKYFMEMQAVIAEMYRVLRPDAAAIVVVGTSVMRGIEVQTHTCLADIAADLEFDVVDVVQRRLDRNKRMMPARFGKKSGSMIEQRMHEEYVIGLLKPEST